MLYKVVHSTRYLYDGSVSQCQSEVRLTPRALPWQTALECRIQTTPEAASVARYTDYFGNDVTAFTILERHDRFVTLAASLVEVGPRTPPAADVAWDAVRGWLARHDTIEALEAFEFVCESPFVPTSVELAAYARPSFEAGTGLVAAVEDLCRRVHTEFRYEPKTTSIDTSVLDTLRARRGVCQDFSHVMIGALRSLGLAARYVSGYLKSSMEYRGAEASHAWVSVFLPGAGWIDFDPTNNVRPDTGHVTLAWGRDYGDVTPVKGIALGGGNQVVEVEVRVEPAPAPAPAPTPAPAP